MPERPSGGIARALRWLSVLLFAVGMARLGVVVFADPMVGFANNYDFLRPASCTGLWQSDGTTVPAQPDGSRPVNALLYTGDREPASCLRAADNLFVHAVTLWHDIGDRVDYRELSTLRLVAFLAVYGALLAVVRDVRFSLVMNAVLVLAVSDSTLTGYFNTLYQEATLLCALFVVIGCCAAVCIVPPRSRTRWALLAGALAVWIGFARVQYLPYSCALLLFAALVAWRLWERRKTAAVFLALVAAVPAFALGLNDPTAVLVRDIRRANATNTVFWAVLPAATDLDRALRVLRLPTHCKAAVGQNWYTPGFVERNPCPEIEAFSRRLLLQLFVEDPATFTGPMGEARSAARPFFPHYVGMFENPADRTSALFQAMGRTSFPLRLSLWPRERYEMLMNAAMLGGLLALGAISAGLVLVPATMRRHGWATTVGLALGLGGATVVYALASSVFGDGYADFAKHASASVIGLGFQAAGLVAAAVGIVPWFVQRHRRRPAHRPATQP